MPRFCIASIRAAAFPPHDYSFLCALFQITLHQRTLRARVKLNSISGLSGIVGLMSLIKARSTDSGDSTDVASTDTAVHSKADATTDPCVLEARAEAGDKTLQVNHIKGRFKGEIIVINQGGATEEVAVVVGISYKFLLRSPLRYSHAVGETVMRNKTQEHATIEAQLYEACEGTDRALLQVKRISI